MAASEAEPLLPVDASSRDLEADGPSSPAPAPMRRFTGTFDDPSLEAAFASVAFREAFAVHVGLMAMAAAASGAIFGADRDTSALIGAVLLLLTVVLRVYLHQRKDPLTAQKLGAASWTIFIVIALLCDLAVATWEGRARQMPRGHGPSRCRSALLDDQRHARHALLAQDWNGGSAGRGRADLLVALL